MRKLSVCVCRASGSVNSFKTQTASSDDIERFRDADRDWEHFRLHIYLSRSIWLFFLFHSKKESPSLLIFRMKAT